MGEVGEFLSEWAELDCGREIRPTPQDMKVSGFLDVSSLLGPGVYALCRWKEIIYIGKAKVVLHRVYAHRNALERMRKGKPVSAVPFSGILIMPCALSDLDRLEREMIKKYEPRYNLRLIPKPKAKFMVVDLAFMRSKEQFVRRV